MNNKIFIDAGAAPVEEVEQIIADVRYFADKVNGEQIAGLLEEALDIYVKAKESK